MLIDDIALTLLPTVGPKTAIDLLEIFGSAETLFNASEAELSERAGLRPDIARSILRRETHADARQELEFAARHNIRILCSTSGEYPQRLRECNDYPHILYVKGEIDLNSRHWLSVVGTRKITPYGAKVCETLISELGELFPDVVIVSGLAYGVDIAAHRAALNAGLATVGILGHPLTHIYPFRHTENARQIVRQGGAVITEFGRSTNPDKSGFVQRNRIIAGLSMGTLIVESAAKGGSLITAEMADGYNRTVMAVPGRLGDIYSEGTNRLIKSLRGQMVCSAGDIAELLDWLPVPRVYPREDEQNALDFADTNPFPNARPDAAREQIVLSGFPAAEDENKSEPFPEISDLPAERNREHSTNQSTMQKPVQQSSHTAVRGRRLMPDPESIAGRIIASANPDTPVSLDEISLKTGIPVESMAAPLLDLEISGFIRILPGKHLLLK